MKKPDYHAKDKGTLGEIAVAKYLMQMGIPTFVDMGDNTKVDLIALKNDVPIKIQVKAYKRQKGKSNVIVYNTKTGPGYKYRYKEKDFDVMAVYLYEIDELFFICIQDLLKVKTSMVIRLKKPKNNQKKNLNLVDKYRSFNRAVKRAGLIC